uniref:Calpain catalytic domain-containing protein n=1 Tax=Globodera pallida TaxID=36090 RepID=A0A183BRC3_GLOPA
MDSRDVVAPTLIDWCNAVGSAFLPSSAGQLLLSDPKDKFGTFGGGWGETMDDWGQEWDRNRPSELTPA